MPKVKISEFSPTPANNTDIDGINLAEGCAPSGINDAIRELMAQLKDFQAGTAGDSFNGPIGTSTAAAGAFTTLAASGAVTLSSGTANGVPYLNGSKVVTSGSALQFDGTNLKIGGTGQLLFDTSGGAGANFIQTVNSFDMRLYCGRGSTSYIDVGTDGQKFAIGGSEQMRLTSTGLGIGTSSPGSKLHLLQAGGVRMRLSDSKNTVAIGSVEEAGDSAIGFFTQTTTERMRLDSSGNLGIGTSSPAYKLDVSVGTNTIAQQWQGAGTNFALRLKSGTGSTSNSSVYRMYMDYLNGTATNGYIDFYRGGGGSDGWLVFGTSGTDRMTLDASGNLGLGVTPSAWSGTYTGSFQMKNGGGLSNNNPNNIHVNNNCYYNGTNWIYVAGSPITASRYEQFNGGHFWFTAPSGTAGNPITFTQAMTLDASGNLMVGTTSGSQKLVVVSTASAAAATSIKCANDGAGTFYLNTSGTADYSAAIFLTAGGATQVGSIVAGATTTTYNITSDQRLKENIQDAASTSDLIDAIQVRQYDWKSDGSHQRYGFIAQELVTVAPEAVHQPTNPDDMMAVDYSKLVPMLVKEIQSLRARVAALESN